MRKRSQVTREIGLQSARPSLSWNTRVPDKPTNLYFSADIPFLEIGLQEVAAVSQGPRAVFRRIGRI